MGWGSSLQLHNDPSRLSRRRVSTRWAPRGALQLHNDPSRLSSYGRLVADMTRTPSNSTTILHASPVARRAHMKRGPVSLQLHNDPSRLSSFVSAALSDHDDDPPTPQRSFTPLQRRGLLLRAADADPPTPQRSFTPLQASAAHPLIPAAYAAVCERRAPLASCVCPTAQNHSPAEPAALHRSRRAPARCLKR